MKARLLLFATLAAVLVALPATALGSTSHVASNSQNYPDSVGEVAPQAPDITSVTVSNDDSGLITFKINVSNRPAFTPDMEFLVFLNTDQKASTGDPQAYGADYVIQLDPGSVNLFQWSASANNYVAAPSQTSLVYSYDATGPTIRINASDLGGTRSFGFGTIAVSGITTDAQGNPSYTNTYQDDAPDAGHGFWSYRVIAPLKLTQTAFTTSRAKAGASFSASLAADESDTNGPVTNGTVACSATVGGKHLAATHSLANGVATCIWKLPKADKGKTVHGSVSLTVQGTTLKKSFAAKVR